MERSPNLKRFQDALLVQNMHYALLQNIDGHVPNGNFFYVCNYSGLGILIVPANDKPLLLVSQMEFERAKQTSSVPVAVMKKKLHEELAARFSPKMIGAKRVGLDYEHTSIQQHTRLHKQLRSSFVDISETCQQLRLRKTPSEMERIEHACKLTDKTFQKTFDSFDSFRSESEVAAFLLNETARIGCEPSFRPIVASGAAGAQPHHEVQPTKLSQGFCVIDYGIKYNGYCADMTRTVFLGKPSKRDHAAYDAVLDAHEAARNAATVDCSFAKIENAARQKLGKQAKYFIHSIGHGLGIDVHEYPFVRDHPNKAFTRLSEGVTFTIEPGIYYPKKFGIRIEDDYVMTKKGARPLTHCDRKLLIL